MQENLAKEKKKEIRRLLFSFNQRHLFMVLSGLRLHLGFTSLFVREVVNKTMPCRARTFSPPALTRMLQFSFCHADFSNLSRQHVFRLATDTHVVPNIYLLFFYSFFAFGLVICKNKQSASY